MHVYMCIGKVWKEIQEIKLVIILYLDSMNFLQDVSQTTYIILMRYEMQIRCVDLSSKNI